RHTRCLSDWSSDVCSSDLGFSVWLAGGGVKGGVSHGKTDELGYNAVEDVMPVHDLHATMLHLLGIDHKRLTFKFQGRDFRLTDEIGRASCREGVCVVEGRG